MIDDIRCDFIFFCNENFSLSYISGSRSTKGKLLKNIRYFQNKTVPLGTIHHNVFTFSIQHSQSFDYKIFRNVSDLRPCQFLHAIILHTRKLVHIFPPNIFRRRDISAYLLRNWTRARPLATFHTIYDRRHPSDDPIIQHLCQRPRLVRFRTEFQTWSVQARNNASKSVPGFIQTPARKWLIDLGFDGPETKLRSCRWCRSNIHMFKLEMIGWEGCKVLVRGPSRSAVASRARNFQPLIYRDFFFMTCAVLWNCRRNDQWYCTEVLKKILFEIEWNFVLLSGWLVQSNFV